MTTAVVNDYKKYLYDTENRAFLYKKSIISELHQVSQTCVFVKQKMSFFPKDNVLDDAHIYLH